MQYPSYLSADKCRSWSQGKSWLSRNEHFNSTKPDTLPFSTFLAKMDELSTAPTFNEPLP
jgi:hypothetical protein